MNLILLNVYSRQWEYIGSYWTHDQTSYSKSSPGDIFSETFQGSLYNEYLRETLEVANPTKVFVKYMGIDTRYSGGTDVG